jgi:hypothetical protein
MDTVEDATKTELVTIHTTRTHPDEKLLTDLRKRKLIEKKYVDESQLSWFQL